MVAVKDFPKRKWINQPSSLQPLHHLHGTNVLAVPEYGSTWTIFFLSGAVVSQRCSGLCLSDGWINPSRASTSELLSAADQAANGSHLDAIPNHDDDSLRAIAFRIADPWAKKALLSHANRIDAAITKATDQQIDLGPGTAGEVELTTAIEIIEKYGSNPLDCVRRLQDWLPAGCAVIAKTK